MSIRLVTFLIAGIFLCGCSPAGKQDQLPAWTGSANRAAIIEFVEATSTLGNKQFVQAAERGWIVVSMKLDWDAVFPAPKTAE
jgi:hypothetical protein